MDTIRGIPALADTDPAALIGQYSRDLRTALNGGRLPAAIAAGTQNITLTAQTGNSQAITFPVGRFTVPPLVLVTKQGGTLAKTIAYVTGVDTAGCSIGLYNADGTTTSGTVAVAWIAIQMLPANAAG